MEFGKIMESEEELKRKIQSFLIKVEEMRNKNEILSKRNKAPDGAQGRVNVINGIAIMLIAIGIVMWLINETITGKILYLP